MFKNANFDVIKMMWDTFTFPVKAGTPVGSNGCLENGKNCIGFIPENILSKPLSEKCLVCTGGDVELNEVEESFGESINEYAKLAIAGTFKFFRDGKGIGLTFPEASETEKGMQFVLPNQADSTATTVAGLKDDFNDLLDKLKTAGLMTEDEE